MIKELKQNLANAEESSKDDSENEIEKLGHDIRNLELENEKKVKMLEDVHEENKMLEEKLEVFALMETNLNENISLDQELSLAEKFECTICDNKFATRNEVKLHSKKIHETQNGAKLLKNRLSKIEKELADQKFDLLSKVLTLKECEKRKKYVCKCKGSCKINHKFYNWTKPKSDKILSKFEIFRVETVNDMESKGDPCQILYQYCSNPWGLNFPDLRVL